MLPPGVARTREMLAAPSAPRKSSSEWSAEYLLTNRPLVIARPGIGAATRVERPPRERVAANLLGSFEQTLARYPCVSPARERVRCCARRITLPDRIDNICNDHFM